MRNTINSYGSVTKFFHWVIAVLVVGMLIYGFCLPLIPDANKAFAYNLHKLIGLTVLSLMVLRLGWRLINPRPLPPVGASWLETMAARSVHLLLYLCVIAMPLAGWIGASAAGKPPILGQFKLGLPIAFNKPLAKQAFVWHGQIAYILIALISLHVLAALYHHVVRKNNVLRRMLPGRGL